MARVQGISFIQLYCCEFESVARGHHIYEKVWKPVVGEKLTRKHDTREEAKLYDEFSVGIYCLSTSSAQDQELVGHLPIELPFPLCKVLSREGCSLEFSPTGERFLEDGPVVPGRYTALSNDKIMVTILHRELERKVEKVKHRKLEVMRQKIKNNMNFQPE